MIIARKYFSDNKKEGETKNNTGKIIGAGLIGSGTAIGGGLLSGHLVRKAHKKALDAETNAYNTAMEANKKAYQKSTEGVSNKARRMRKKADDIAADFADFAESKLKSKDNNYWNSAYNRSYNKNMNRIDKVHKSMQDRLDKSFRSRSNELISTFDTNSKNITNKFNKIGKAGKVGAVVLGAGAGLGAYKLMNRKKKNDDK